MNKKDKNFSFAQEMQRAAQEQSQGKKLLIQPQAPGSSPLRPQSISVFGLSLIPRNQENHSIISVYIYDPDTLFKKENTLCNYPDCHLSSPKMNFYCGLLLATKQWGKKPHQK